MKSAHPMDVLRTKKLNAKTPAHAVAKAMRAMLIG
jgi:hypothetical protein